MSRHAANADKSARLLRVLGVLASRGGWWISSLDLQTAARVCAVGTCVSELRANGHNILCERRGRAWFYVLAAPPTKLHIIAGEARP